MGVRVRQKTKGKGQPWWVFVSHNSKRTSIKVGTKKAAQDVADEIAAELKLGKFDMNRKKEKPVPTFKDYADAWVKTTVLATCKPSTLSGYQTILDNHVLWIFGDLPINEINRGAIKKFLLDKTNEGFSRSSVHHFRSVLSCVFNDALDDELIPANPTAGIKNTAKRKPKNDAINPLSPDELSNLLNAVYEHYHGHYPLFLVLARTGMRIGEVIALQWDDINFQDRYIHVQRSYVRGELSYPKSGKDRKVDMSPQLAETLKQLKGNFKLRVVDDKPEPEFIFKNTTGGMLNTDNWRRRIFKPALEKAKVRKIRINDIRHTYATLRISKGDNIADVSRQLGHHSVKLTLDVYYHWMPGDKKAEVDALDDLSPMHPNAPQVHPEVDREVASIG